MKYIKSFENKKEKNIQSALYNNIINEYIPGFYIIFKYESYQWKKNKMSEYLALGKIGIPEIFDEGDIRLKIDIISFIYELDQSDLPEEDTFKSGNKYINLKLKTFKKIFASTSLKQTQDKFDELKKEQVLEWEINSSSSKFNI